jgi:chromosome segregation ATPase
LTEERQKDSKEDKGAKGRTDKKRIKVEFSSLKKALGDGEASGLLIKAGEKDVQAILGAVEERIDEEMNPLWADFVVVEERATTAGSKADKAEKRLESLSKRVSEFEESADAKEKKLAELSETLTQMKNSTEQLQKKADEASEALTLEFQTKEEGKKTMKGNELIRYLADTVNGVHKGVGSVRRELNGIKKDIDGIRKELGEFKEEVEGTLTLFMEALQEKGILPKPEGD